MTNVKLKLMYFLLNALLTADIVHARPYSDNTTDVVIKYNTNSTYLPIDPNSDTLIVANEEMTMAESKNQMNALMDAEQNRDEDLAKKGHKDESSEERTKHMNNRMEMMYSDQPSPDESPTVHIEEHREHTSAETHEHSHTNMEALLNAEQDRDEELSEKTMKEHKMDFTGTENKYTNIQVESQNNAQEEGDDFSKIVTDDHRKSEEEHIDHTSAETHKHSNTNMEALMNAEQDRDEDLAEKTMKEHTLDASDIMNKTENVNLEAIMTAERDRDAELLKKVMPDYKTLELSQKHNDEIEKQLNKEHPLIEHIIDSETDREDTLTDILFRPESEFADMPRFEFLIAAKINESDIDNGSVNIKSGVRDNYLDKVEKNSSDVLKKVDYVELVEVLKPLSENMSAYSFENITGHEVDNDLAPDTRFTDLQTLFLACFATLLPLLGVLFATLLIRCMCRRWCPGWCSKPTDISESDSSEKDPPHQQLKSPTHETSAATMENGDGPPANGSIITMTLKNNHLIVETEERNDITKNGRETKMKYSPDNDGIFVVEVQQSTAYRPNNKSLQNSPPHDPQISTNQALIHRVPEELEKRVEEDSERSSGKFDRDKALALSSTGLSISDLSMSSIGSHNVSYSYGSQIGYEQGPFGYPVYAGYDISKEDSSEGIVHDNSQEPLITKTPTDPYKPVVTAAIFKQDSIIGNDALQGPGYCIEGSSDGPLLSDVQAREISLQHLHDKKIENGIIPTAEKVASPKVLTRADSLPAQRDDRNSGTSPDKNSAMETITENDSDIPSKDALKGKRASLPIIRTEVYEVKEVESRSPEFKRNEVLAEGTFEPPPLITITEEGDGKCDSTS